MPVLEHQRSFSSPGFWPMAKAATKLVSSVGSIVSVPSQLLPHASPGIQPGLDRISRLLKDVDLPWKSIHVAGTNGKGSICHYASCMLTRRSIKNGRFTTPHLVNRRDSIQISREPVEESYFRSVESHYLWINKREHINASPFEILTATAFHIFTEQQVHIGVVEVGMGGTLDATNILNNQAISVIGKIARDHEGFLGDKLEEIALHKAGILKPNIPYMLYPMNEWNVQFAVETRALEIGAGPRITSDDLTLYDELFKRKAWRRFAEPLQEFQRENAILGILAAKYATESLGLNYTCPQILDKCLWLSRQQFPGRQERSHVPPVFDKSDKTILLDGAHNPDAAKELHKLVHQTFRMSRLRYGSTPPGGLPVTWVLAMSAGKDASRFLQQILRSGDNVITTSFEAPEGMPWVKCMEPRELFKIAREVQPNITGLPMPKEGVLRAICAAKHLAGQYPIVVTGSLYLVGGFHREMKNRGHNKWLKLPEYAGDRRFFDEMKVEERNRINALWSLQDSSHDGGKDMVAAKRGKSSDKGTDVDIQKLQEELDALDIEMQKLEAEEQRLDR